MCGYTIDESTSRIPARQACRAKLQRDRDDILDGENNRHRGMQPRLFMRQLLGEHVVKESQVQCSFIWSSVDHLKVGPQPEPSVDLELSDEK